MKQEIQETEEFKTNGYWKGDVFHVEYETKILRQFYLVFPDLGGRKYPNPHNELLKTIVRKGTFIIPVEICIDNDGDFHFTGAANTTGVMCVEVIPKNK